MNVKFRRITALILVVLTLAALAACGVKEPEESTGSTMATERTTAQSYLTVGTTELRTVYLTRVPGASSYEPPAIGTEDVVGTTSGTEASTDVTGSTNDDEPSSVQSTQTYAIPSQLALSCPPPSVDTLDYTEEEIDEFFSDVVFVGDSISLGWRNYVTSKRAANPGFLRGAQFLVSGSLGAESALWEVSSESVHPTWLGSQMQLWDSIPLTGAKKVFIMFGLNDVGRYSDVNMGISMAVSNYDDLIDNIKANAPDVEVYIISATYVLEGGEKGHVTSANLRKLNEALIDYCNDEGIEFINFADALADSNGNLAAEYCSDGYVHQTNAAYDVWTALLRGYAVGEMIAK